MDTIDLHQDIYNSYREAQISAYQKVSDEVYHSEKLKKETFQMKDYHFLSANLTKFLPQIDKKEYFSIYHKLVTHTRMSANSFDYVNFDAINYIKLRGNTDFLAPEARKKPKIFCTYHLGGYRGILPYLMKSGFPLALVIDKRTYDLQKEIIENLVEKVNEVIETPVKLKIVMAENADIARSLMLSLLGGYSVLIFLDGNTGVGGMYSRSEKQLKMNFLNQEIYSRSGIASLSYATKVPIIPIISYYEDQVPCYEALNPVTPNIERESSMDEYVQESMSKLYLILERYLTKYYDQWESWFYFHRFLNVEAIKNIETNITQECTVTEKIEFNTDDFGLFKIHQDNCLFNKMNYSTSIINETQFERLAILEGNNTSYSIQNLSEIMDANWIDSFLKMGVLRKTI